MELAQFFEAHPRVAIAFSGGVDSAYLLWAAAHYGAEACGYFVKSAFQPQFELDDARRLAGELGVAMKVLPVDVLADATVAANPADRCYHCKRVIFERIAAAAAADGYTELLDGTNASDEAGLPPRDARPAGAARALAAADVRPEQGRNSAALPGGGALHLGQARLRLSGHPRPHRRDHHGGEAGGDRRRRRIISSRWALRISGCGASAARPAFSCPRRSWSGCWRSGRTS